MVFLVVGTRPEAIKMAPVILELRKRKIIFKVIGSGQHLDMLDEALNVFKLKTDLFLNIREKGGSLVNMFANGVSQLAELALEYKVKYILFHGDTLTSFIASNVAFLSGIPCGHVEAGLRTYDKTQPWPEESIRRVNSILTDHHFAPTEYAKGNILNEKVCQKQDILVTGNTVIDALFEVVDQQKHQELGQVKSVLLTAHRRENIPDGLISAFKGINRFSSETGIKIIFPMHPNPHVRDIAKSIFKENEQIELIEPRSYSDFCDLMTKVDIIITDSGGIQEEAPSLNKPVLVLRNKTERPEALECNGIKLIGTEEENVYHELMKLCSDANAYNEMAYALNPFGDGDASKRIVDFLQNHVL